MVRIPVTVIYQDMLLSGLYFQGFEPFFVNATAGTTVLGAYDPLHAIADVCERHGLWMHVDGCWGGSAAASGNYRHLVSGVER